MPNGITFTDAFGSICCTPDCEAAAMEDAPFPICERHYSSLVRHFLTMSRAAGVAVTDMDSILGRRAAIEPAQLVNEYVYFIRYRDRIKIGTTTNPARRLAGLPFDEVLAVIPGGRRVEREWHQRYEGHRDRGEWFTFTEGMLLTIRGLGICSAA